MFPRAAEELGAEMGRSRVVALAAAAMLCLGFVSSLPAAAGARATGDRLTGTAQQLLGQLRATSEHSLGYSRALFHHWIDADQDGCNTRQEVLIQESRTSPVEGRGCSLVGSWRSAYDGKSTTRAATLDIDHVVALKEAWDSGAWAWSAARREAYANDLGDSRTLRAVSASSNRSKSDKDPAEWLPPLAAFRCTYATDWVVIKARWDLAVDSREAAALRRLLRGCPSMSVSVTIVPLDGSDSAPSVTAEPTVGPSPSPTPTATPIPTSTGCDPNYAGYCVPIVPYDLDCKDIKHRVTVIGIDHHHFDGDGDGIGCESYTG